MFVGNANNEHAIYDTVRAIEIMVELEDRRAHKRSLHAKEVRDGRRRERKARDRNQEKVNR